MKRILIIISSLALWIGIVVYFVLASNFSAKKQRGVVVDRIEVIIKDSSSQRLLTSKKVMSWLSKEKIQLKNRDVSKINTLELKRFLERQEFVKSASVYVDMSGLITLEFEQRKPIARFNTSNGYNFYLTDDGYILPLQNHDVIYVPIVTGDFNPPFERSFTGSWRAKSDKVEKKVSENYKFFEKLINFVIITSDDSFWNSHIVQINILGIGSVVGGLVLKESEVELVPRVGNHIVRLGRLDNVDHKLDKLMLFYESSADNNLWNTSTYINLDYDGQVVCTKM